MNLNLNGLLQISWGDIFKTIFLAILVGLTTWITSSVDVLNNLPPEVKAAIITGACYIVKNLFTTNNGNVLGIAGGK